MLHNSATEYSQISFRVSAMERENQHRFDPCVSIFYELSDSRKKVLQTPLPLSLISPLEVS